VKCRQCKAPMTRAATGRPRRYCSDNCRVIAWQRRHRKLSGSRAVMGSSRSCEWPTPAYLFAKLVADYGPFDLDPCATAENAKCPRFFTKEQDGLAQVWTGRVFMNPPYGREISAWMRKAWEASQTTAELVLCLVPVRTGSRWWQEWVKRGEVDFLPGRVKWRDNISSPFDSATVRFRKDVVFTKPALKLVSESTEAREEGAA
jgi:phage N-6-adenine-methyltransferase